MTNSDPVLEALSYICKFYGLSGNFHQLTAGLPLHNGHLTPELVPDAAQRVGLKAEIRERSLGKINPLALPALLIHADGSVSILEKIVDDVAYLSIMTLALVSKPLNSYQKTIPGESST